MLATFLAALSFFGTGEKIVVSARCEPSIVRPGGWVDIVIVYEFEAGWGTTSPLSRGGPRVRLALDMPAGFRTSGALRAPAGDARQDPVFGALEHLSGSGELRQRVHVPANQPAGRVRFGARTTWVVCDAAGCLPPQGLDLEVSFKVAADGAPGPSATQEWKPDAADCERIGSGGYASRLTVERGAVRAGDEVFAVLDLARPRKSASGPVALRTQPEFALGEAWAAATRSVEGADGQRYDVTSWIVPFRVGDDAAAQVRLAVDVQFDGPAGTRTAFQAGHVLDVAR